MANILGVDDQSDLLFGIALALESDGHHVLSAHDGLEALAIIRSEPIDLVLSDIAMPEMNGYQLYQRVRENPDWLHIPFILMSGRDLDSDIRYGKELGVDDYLTKPIRRDDLVATVRGKLRRARQLHHVQPTTSALEEGPIQIKLDTGLLDVDAEQHRANLDGRPLHLTTKELVMLDYFVKHANAVVSPAQLVQRTHGFEAGDAEASVLLRSIIRSLRRKLGYDVGEMGCIENVRSVGYRFTPSTP